MLKKPPPQPELILQIYSGSERMSFNFSSAFAILKDGTCVQLFITIVTNKFFKQLPAFCFPCLFRTLQALVSLLNSTKAFQNPDFIMAQNTQCIYVALIDPVLWLCCVNTGSFWTDNLDKSNRSDNQKWRQLHFVNKANYRVISREYVLLREAIEFSTALCI